MASAFSMLQNHIKAPQATPNAQTSSLCYDKKEKPQVDDLRPFYTIVVTTLVVLLNLTSIT